MNTGAAIALQCAEDLALKSFVAARCARRQMEVEVGASSRVAELEEKVVPCKRKKPISKLHWLRFELGRRPL